MAIPYESDVQLDDPFNEPVTGNRNQVLTPPVSSSNLSGPPITLNNIAPLPSISNPNTAHSFSPNQTIPSEDNIGATNANPPSSSPPSSSMFSFSYYQQFFNINTAQVLNRITNAMLPIFPPDYLYGRNWHIVSDTNDTTVYNQEEGEEEGPVVAGVKLSLQPDLYGPFWICTTLWVTIGVMSNVMSRISYALNNNGDSSEEWIFDFVLVPVACATIYLYCFVFGAIVWGVMKWKFLPVALTDTICLYGYSMFVFELIALLCVVPSTAFQWIMVLLGGVWSASYLIVNLWHMLKRNLTPQWFLGVVGTVVVGHLLLTLSLKLYFFRYKI